MGLLNFNASVVSLFDDESRYDEFRSLKDLYSENGSEKEYEVRGVYTYSSKYGESCFIKSDGYNIQLPNHMTETVKQIREDWESVNQINSGNVVVIINSYELPDKYPNKTFYSTTFKLK